MDSPITRQPSATIWTVDLDDPLHGSNVIVFEGGVLFTKQGTSTATWFPSHQIHHVEFNA